MTTEPTQPTDDVIDDDVDRLREALAVLIDDVGRVERRIDDEHPFAGPLAEVHDALEATFGRLLELVGDRFLCTGMPLPDGDGIVE